MEKTQTIKNDQEIKEIKRQSGAIQKWVKKLVSTKEWNSYYSHIGSYCPLVKEKNGIWIGFCVANVVPNDCLELREEELLQVDDYRMAVGIYPRPLKERKQEDEYMHGDLEKYNK